MFIILRCLLVRCLLGAYLLQAFSGTETIVRFAIRNEFISVLSIDIKALGLDIWSLIALLDELAICEEHAFVRHKASRLHYLCQTLDRAFDETIAISIFDTQDERAAMALGEEIVIERGTEAADMEVASR